MSYEKKEYKPYPDSGSLRASQTKKGAKSPDYWGNIAINLKDLANIQTVDGLTVIKLSGWKKQDKQGKTYLSIAVDRFVPEQRGGSGMQTRRQEDDLDDGSDIPF